MDIPEDDKEKILACSNRVQTNRERAITDAKRQHEKLCDQDKKSERRYSDESVLYFLTAIVDGAMGLKQFLNRLLEAHPELEVTALSGGLFMDGHPLSAFPYMSDTNRRIADMFGVEFGKPYLNLLEDGKYGS